MANLDRVKKALNCFTGDGDCPECPCEFNNGTGCERQLAKFVKELISAQEETIKNLLMQIEDLGKPLLINMDDENYSHLPITKCPKCKRPVRMYYNPAETVLTKACPYCGQMVRWE